MLLGNIALVGQRRCSLRLQPPARAVSNLCILRSPSCLLPLHPHRMATRLAAPHLGTAVLEPYELMEKKHFSGWLPLRGPHRPAAGPWARRSIRVSVDYFPVTRGGGPSCASGAFGLTALTDSRCPGNQAAFASHECFQHLC